MGWFKNILKMALGKGGRISYSSGKPFDPRNQKRTDAMEDILHPRKKKRRNVMPGRDGTGPRGGGGRRSGGQRGPCK